MKRGVRFLSVLLFLIMAAGCQNNSGSSGSAGSSVPVETVTIKTVSMFGGTDATAGLYTELISEFTGANENIKVSDSSNNSDAVWKSQIIKDFNSGNEPDVLFFFNGADAKDILNKVVSLDTIRSVYPDYAENINENVLDSMTENDGAVYAVPVRGYWEGLFINKDLFDEHDIDYPSDWNKFVSAVEKFKDAGIIPVSISLGSVPHYWIEHLILSAGGTEDHKLNPKGENSDVPESWTLGLSYFNTLREMGAFSSDADIKPLETAELDFIEKRAAMAIDGSWFCGRLANEGVEVLPFPVIPGGKMTYGDIISGYSAGYYITKKAWEDESKRDAAVKFVMHMTSDESIRKMITGAEMPAADIDIPDSDSTAVTTGRQMAERAGNFSAAMDSRISKDSWDYIVNNIVDIAEGKKDAVQVLAEAIKRGS